MTAIHAAAGQDLVVEGLLGHEPLEPRVLFFRGLQPRRLAPLQAAVLLLPAVEGLLADAVLAAERRRRRARFMLLQDADDLFLREPAPAHAVLLGAPPRRGLPLSVDQFSGGRSLVRQTGRGASLGLMHLVGRGGFREDRHVAILAPRQAVETLSQIALPA